LLKRGSTARPAAAAPGLAVDGAPLTAHTGRVDAVAFHPDRPLLASGGWDKAVRLWDTGARTQRRLDGHRGPITCAAFTPGGELLTGSWDRQVLAWDVDGTAPSGAYTGHTDIVYALAVSADGTLLATGGRDRTVRLWSTETRTLLHTLRGHSGTVYAVAFHPDGSTLASAGVDGKIRLWNPATGDPRSTLTGHTGDVWTLAYAPDGVLASAGEDHTIRLWPGPRVLTAHTAPVTSLAWHPTGSLYSADTDRTLHHWPAATSTSISTLTPHTDRIDALALSPTALATASWDRTLRLWHLP
ncbi:WD40 repeat domain-containing protein, partial [Actinocorallia lasiicapitis]